MIPDYLVLAIAVAAASLGSFAGHAAGYLRGQASMRARYRRGAVVAPTE